MGAIFRNMLSYVMIFYHFFKMFVGLLEATEYQCQTSYSSTDQGLFLQEGKKTCHKQDNIWSVKFHVLCWYDHHHLDTSFPALCLLYHTQYVNSAIFMNTNAISVRLDKEINWHIAGFLLYT